MKPDVAIIGAGYVGMPLAQVFAQAGKNVVLRDVKREIVDGINRGESHIGDVPSGELKRLVDAGLIKATLDIEDVAEADAILIALAAPLRSSSRICARDTSWCSSRRRIPARPARCFSRCSNSRA